MKIKEIMTQSPIKTSVDSTVTDAAKIMDSKNIGCILIEENEKIIGIITERDILRKIVAKGVDPQSTSVRAIMTSPIITMEAENSIEEANALMTSKKIRRLPIDDDGKIIGMVTIRDITNNLRYSLGKSILGR